MNKNAEVIFMLCSHLQSDPEYKPYEPSEWSRLAETLKSNGAQPCDLPKMTDADLFQLTLSADGILRLRGLIARGGSLAFEMEKYESMGISVVTRADAGYPKILKMKLGQSCPPLLYYAGNLKLAGAACIGFAGSRNTDENDIRFTSHIVKTVNAKGYAVVSGGAKGVDTAAQDASLKNGNAAVIYLADSMVKKVRNRQIISAIQQGKLLLLSAVKPDMGFTAATAMMRNRFIYAQSSGTVVVRSDYKKGGTWTGAYDCLKHEFSPVFCWDNKEYRGNQELIKLGAIPISENWDANVSAVPKKEEFVQLSLLD